MILFRWPVPPNKDPGQYHFFLFFVSTIVLVVVSGMNGGSKIYSVHKLKQCLNQRRKKRIRDFCQNKQSDVYGFDGKAPTISPDYRVLTLPCMWLPFLYKKLRILNQPARHYLRKASSSRMYVCFLSQRPRGKSGGDKKVLDTGYHE